ncbi:uncharacterized protein LOC131160966 [Malania oleifera]|uniref:uncharacterized protein LOC131160966 n=1 Tax=Malania oleifera TaxID=397392 RepID=UPI0025AE7FDE|nr:uncharacterized protein LOC131160966 [Malania oleifera]
MEEYFKVEFNVVEEDNQTANHHWPSYTHFIRSLRTRLAVDGYSHNLPVLPPPHHPPPKSFDVFLKTHSASCTLRVRADNLHLLAFQPHSNSYTATSNQWFEFGRDDDQNPQVPHHDHLVPESFFLGFRPGCYADLENACGEKVETTKLGSSQLVDAVNQLAISEESQDRARSLIVVTQMICESIKFQRISDHLATTFRSCSPPPDWMLALGRGWENLSAALHHADADPDMGFQIPQPNDMNIATADEAVAALGVLSGRSAVPLTAKGNHSMVIRDGGQPLAEVFAVRINNIDGEDPGDLYGIVKVIDGLGIQFIYNRKSSEYESIRPGQNALLSGPDRAISAIGSFTIDLDLWDYDTLSSDDEIARGQIFWNAYDPNNKLDTPLLSDVNGKYGSATVKYAVLSDAVVANVEVILIDGDGEDPADVYGDICARSSIFSDESQLFRKASKEYINVRPRERISLSRSVVAVPLDATLIIKALLYDYDTLSSDDEIANGTAEFPAQSSGLFTKNITGKYGEIQVNVKWSTA